jgi:hypothetical protein
MPNLYFLPETKCIQSYYEKIYLKSDTCKPKMEMVDNIKVNLGKVGFENRIWIKLA